MIRDLIIEFSPLLIMLIIIAFVIIKVSIISVSINKSYFSLFLSSFMFFNHIAIRNTFHEKLRQFYRRSNKVNGIFYTMLAIVVAVYILMKAI